MATEFTAATPLIPYHRRTENLGVNVVVRYIHVDCSPSIRCQRTPLLPKRTRLTHIASNQGKPIADCREYRSRQPRAACPSVWPVGQSLLSSWLRALVPPKVPTSPDCLARREPFASCKHAASLPSQRPSPDDSRGFRLRADRLSTCSPLPH